MGSGWGGLLGDKVTIGFTNGPPAASLGSDMSFAGRQQMV